MTVIIKIKFYYNYIPERLSLFIILIYHHRPDMINRGGEGILKN